MISELLARFIEVLFPPRDREALLRDTPLDTYRLLVRPKEIAGADALLPYTDKRVNALIWELKYRDSSLAAEVAGTLLAEYLEDILSEELVHTALIIPVPLHAARLRERGYNQCERMAHVVAKRFGNRLTLAPDALMRVRNTPRQTTLSKKERLLNMADAFEANEDAVSGKTCVLIDDVVTTGTTIAEAAQTLLNAGAARVISIGLAWA